MPFKEAVVLFPLFDKWEKIIVFSQTLFHEKTAGVSFV